jgi:hypothetical protein
VVTEITSLEHQRTRTEIMTNKATPVTGTVYVYLLYSSLILCLVKAKAHVCTPKMAKGLSAYFASSYDMSWLCNKSPFSAFHHISLFGL